MKLLCPIAVLLCMPCLARSDERSQTGVDGKAGHWSFRPIGERSLPRVHNVAWPQSPVDFFVLSELERSGLSPSRPADKLTLIRRAAYDLTGLPPTPQEINDFLADTSPDAFDRVVDRLLASPQYGEKWGRHWLDVARYADSNGLDENIAHGNAWRYRDYVISSFNQDKPFDRFLLEQIAGDLLPASDLKTRHQQLIATGLLSLGPKVLAEVDERKMEMDIVDEQIDTVGRAFMALTLGCARCHDHKFDPITTNEYYALAGIFKSTRTMEHFKKVARWWENPLASESDLALQATLQKKIENQKQSIQNLITQAKQSLEATGKPPPTDAKELEAAFPEDTRTALNRLRAELKQMEDSMPDIPYAMGVTEGSVCDVPVHIRGSHLTTGQVMPHNVPAVLVRGTGPAFPATQSGRLELANWLISPDHPLTSRVIVNRIWRWHFGKGIVRTTDNFGLLGEAPSHAALLDWLARSFMKSGWSIKAMHRTIMLSSTYQMGSDCSSRSLQLDPENRLLSRFPIRRLEAEEIRDGILSLCGTLDRSQTGSLLQVKNREFFFDHTSRDNTRYDSQRRTIYLPVVRNHLYDLFQLFDSSDASVCEGDRHQSSVAPQALFFMNSDLVLQAARDLARNLMEKPCVDRDRIRELYFRTYGRMPTNNEIGDAMSLLNKLRDPTRTNGKTPEERAIDAWTWMCQTVLSANEFIYIR